MHPIDHVCDEVGMTVRINTIRDKTTCPYCSQWVGDTDGRGVEPDGTDPWWMDDD